MNEREQFEAWFRKATAPANKFGYDQGELWWSWKACAESKQAELDKANAEVEHYLSAYRLAHKQAMDNGQARDIARTALDNANAHIAKISELQNKRFNEFEHECQIEVEELNTRIAQLEEALKGYIGNYINPAKIDKMLEQSPDTWLLEHDKAVEVRVLEEVSANVYISTTSRGDAELEKMIESRSTK